MIRIREKQQKRHTRHTVATALLRLCVPAGTTTMFVVDVLMAWAKEAAP